MIIALDESTNRLIFIFLHSLFIIFILNDLLFMVLDLLFTFSFMYCLTFVSFQDLLFTFFFMFYH